MIRRTHSSAFLYAGLILGLFAWASPASTKDAIYCVTCKNPDQVYRCQVTGVGSRANDAVKLYCIIRTAKEGNHASCKASRGAKDCEGIAKVYTYDGPAIPPEVANDPRVQGLMDKIAREQTSFDKPKKGNAPKTMFELGGRAVSASRKGLRNARSALGGGSSESSEPVPLTAPSPPAESQPVVENPSASEVTSPAAAANPPVADSLSVASEEADRPNRIQRAGTAVGGFARKSYRCMTSFFRNCRDEADGTVPQ